MPEFGDPTMHVIPSKLRHKFDRRWEVGTYLGRSWNSDQNFVGNWDGAVIRARAMVRVVENKIWQAGRIRRIRGTPSTEKPHACILSAVGKELEANWSAQHFCLKVSALLPVARITL